MTSRFISLTDGPAANEARRAGPAEASQPELRANGMPAQPPGGVWIGWKRAFFERSPFGRSSI